MRLIQLAALPAGNATRWIRSAVWSALRSAEKTAEKMKREPGRYHSVSQCFGLPGVGQSTSK